MLNRLLGIIYTLMNRGTVTAAELAKRYEVSVRTIYRDVEALSMAGIPVYARKGKNGGISLTEEFVLNKMLISKEEQQEILSALACLRETGAGQEEILQKLGEFFREETANWVAIDFSDWSGRRKELFEQIRQAVLGHHVMVFDYYSQYGKMSHREVEPMQLLFKDYTWYLRAFCREKGAMRLFKVLRMKRVQVTEEIFELCRELKSMPEDEKMCLGEMYFPEVVLQIDKREAYRIYDRFEEEEIRVLPEGDFLIRTCCPVDDWLYGVILSFGPSAKVLAPKGVEQEIRKRISKMMRRYE